jgi:hypothetical protein
MVSWLGFSRPSDCKDRCPILLIEQSGKSVEKFTLQGRTLCSPGRLFKGEHKIRPYKFGDMACDNSSYRDR